MSFPWLNDLQILLSDTLNNIKDYDKLNEFNEKKIIVTLLEDWAIISKVLSLHINKKYSLSKKYIGQYLDKSEIDENDIYESLFNFSQKLLSVSKRRLVEETLQFIGTVATKYKSEFLTFKKYFQEELFDNIIKNVFNIFNEYFDCFSEFTQTSIYLKFDKPMPKNYIATSNDFNKTKMFYGNTFEILSDHLMILCCINNIANGRPFYQFEQMDLKQYLMIDKANRANPISNNKILFNFASEFDNQIRNATHHSATVFNKNTSTIHYTTGRSNTKRQLSYAIYLYKCNEILFNLVALFNIELSLNL